MQGPGIIKDETGAQTLLGYVVDLSSQNGVGRCVLDIGAQHGNRHGALHGGIIACLLDNAMGYGASVSVSADGASKFLTVSMTTQFLASAKEGRVVASGWVTGGGCSVLFAQGELHDDTGRLLATATGVYKRIREG